MKYLIFILLLIIGSGIYSQTKNDIIQERIEFIAQDLEVEDISLEDIFDVLNKYYDSKLNLNTATKSELEELMMVNDFQINALLQQRKEKGLFKTIYEVKDIEYWDLQTLENIIPFVMVSEVESKSKKEKGNFYNYLKEGDFEGYLRFIRVPEKKAGYEKVSDEEKENSSKYYWGDPNKIYSRLRYTHKKEVSIGITMSKDPGEQIFGKTQPYGFDFYSAHAYYSSSSGNKFIKKAAIGDYQVQIGQGLAFWSGYGFNKTADASSTRKKPQGLRAYTSADQVRFMRGAGIEIGIKEFSLTTWASYKSVGGTVNIIDTLDIDDEFAQVASSVNSSGYHRTTSELNRKNSIKEFIYGANLKYQLRNFQIGISAIQQEYDVYYQRADQLSNKYQFSGNKLLSLSADYSYIHRNFNVFGEVAQSKSSNAVAFLQGVSLAISRKATISAIYRFYPKDYHTFYSRGFGDGSNTINESGIYFGGSFNLSKAWRLNTYVDFFESPWLKYGVNGPSRGNEVLGQLTYKPNARFEARLRIRNKNKMVNASIYEGNIRPLENEQKLNRQLEITSTLGGGWRWKSRIDYVTYNRDSREKQNGVALTQDLLYRNSKSPLEISLRYSIFNTDSYDARLYIYEYNMQNVFSIPTYYNKGSRAYVTLRYTFFKERFDLWLRYGVFVYDKLDKISSGPEEIKGSVKSEVGAQLRVRL